MTGCEQIAIHLKAKRHFLSKRSNIMHGVSSLITENITQCNEQQQ